MTWELLPLLSSLRHTHKVGQAHPLKQVVRIRWCERRQHMGPSCPGAEQIACKGSCGKACKALKVWIISLPVACSCPCTLSKVWQIKTAPIFVSKIKANRGTPALTGCSLFILFSNNSSQRTRPLRQAASTQDNLPTLILKAFRLVC